MELVNNNTNMLPQNQNLQTSFANRFSKRSVFIALGIIFAFLTIFILFNYLKSEKTAFLKPLAGDGSKVRDIMNPITGTMYNLEEADEWLGVRPLGVMLNNHTDARPHSGLVDADLTYEIVAEGGITRLLPFYLTNTPEKIGPIRSTRAYYLMLVKELGDAMLMHEGWSPQALEAIETWPVRSLQRGGASATANWRDNPFNVATEHTLFTNGVKLRERGDELGWDGKTDKFVVWDFKDTSDLPEIGDAQPNLITIDFWSSGDYSAIWQYDRDANEYLRFTGYDAQGAPILHNDRETKEQVKVKNVIVQFATETSIAGDDKNRLEYELIGSGQGLVFLDGKVQNVTWVKESRDARTMYYAEDGDLVKFNRGKFWVSIVPDRNISQVSY